MRKQGFTLIELLAVIVILAVIALIATPIILGIINDTKKSAFKDSAYGISQAAKNSFVEMMYKGEEPVDIVYTYTNGVESSEPSGYTLKYNGDKPAMGKVSLTKAGKVGLVLHDGKYCVTKGYADADITIEEKTEAECNDQITIVLNIVTLPDFNEEEGVNRPKLLKGMIPVKWDGIEEVETVSTDSDWYDYTNKKWANAKTSDGSYWVWVPRYIYKISSGWHTSTVGNIEVQFSKGTDDNWNSSVIGALDTGTGSSASNNKWTNHLAFKFGSTELTGIWVSKYEMSGSGNSLESKPNVSSLRSVNIKDMFTYSRNMETNDRYGWGTSGVGLDTHMMKNTEWGMVAYLTQSTYGKNSEVWSNNSGTYVTGCAGNSVSEAEYMGCQNAYNTTNGVKASTTGTIYGIYDMSGGSWEYTSAYVDNGNITSIEHGNTIINAANKYKDVYSIGTSDTSALNYAAANVLKGDALYETSSLASDSSAWYGDATEVPYGERQFFIRGGRAVLGARAGIFAYFSLGPANDFVSWRTTLVALNEEPVITLNGESTVYVTQGSSYTDAGATASDPESGSLTSSIQTNSNVNTSSNGTYTVTYNVTDSNGNTSVATRKVIVGTILSGPGYITSKSVNGPVMAKGMIPIKWNGSIWVTTSETDTDWYNYNTTDKKWANAITADGSMWVWIPRYVYKISTGWHSSTTGTISVQFSQGTNDAWNSAVIGALDTGTGATASNNKYTNHPGFKFDNNELTGIWVAKFEPTAAEGVANGYTADWQCPINGDNVLTKTVKIIPNVASWRCITTDNSFKLIRNMETKKIYGWTTASDLKTDGTFTTDNNGVDIHLMKNIEWGTIAYLSKSQYGKNSEAIYINNSQTYITGCAGTSESTAAYNGCQNAYNTTNGVKASTTGTIYGIYDLNGGAWESISAYVNNGNIINNAISNAANKYKDIYTVGGTDSEAANYSLTQNFKGDALYETSSNIGGNYSWFNGYTNMPNNSNPTFVRGGMFVNGQCGIFRYAYNNTHYANTSNTFRPVLAVGTGL